MLIIENTVHRIHNPDKEYFMQQVIPYNDSPERIASIETSLRSISGLKWKTSDLLDESILYGVHTKPYIEYIKKVSSLSKSESDYRTPFVIPNPSLDTAHISRQADRVAYYALDVTSPIGGGTFNAALNSASMAYDGAKMILEGNDKIVYALCRPPGHHAESQRYGGYCYFNNACVAADYLLKSGRVTILDIDFHHGNGIQEIFYSSESVRYISIHADPSECYPYYTGYEDERGTGKGYGNNFNIPLPKKTGNTDYTKALERAAELIKKHNTEILVISVGYDTYENDPVGALLLTEEYYRVVGTFLKNLGYPTLIIQEGGYMVNMLGHLAANFTIGFLDE